MYGRKVSVKGEKELFELKQSDFFGEVELLINSYAFNKVVSTKYSVLGEITKRNFRRILTYFPSF